MKYFILCTLILLSSCTGTTKVDTPTTLTPITPPVRLEDHTVSSEIKIFPETQGKEHIINNDEEGDYYKAAKTSDTSEGGKKCAKKTKKDCYKIDLSAKVDGDEILMVSYPLYEESRVMVRTIGKINGYILFSIGGSTQIFDTKSKKIIWKGAAGGVTGDKEYYYGCRLAGLDSGYLQIVNLATQSENILFDPLRDAEKELASCKLGDYMGHSVLMFTLKNGKSIIEEYVYHIEEGRIERIK